MYSHYVICSQATAQHASDLLEQDEMDKRELFEQNQDITVSITMTTTCIFNTNFNNYF